MKIISAVDLKRLIIFFSCENCQVNVADRHSRCSDLLGNVGVDQTSPVSQEIVVNTIFLFLGLFASWSKMYVSLMHGAKVLKILMSFVSQSNTLLEQNCSKICLKIESLEGNYSSIFCDHILKWQKIPDFLMICKLKL